MLLDQVPVLEDVELHVAHRELLGEADFAEFGARGSNCEDRGERASGNGTDRQ